MCDLDCKATVTLTITHRLNAATLLVTSGQTKIKCFLKDKKEWK